MNAILRDECEATVLTNEAIEVQLSYLRPAVEAVQAELPEIRKEIKAADEKLTGKIDQLSDQIRKVQGSVEGMKWFVSSLAIIASGLSVAHTLGWI